MAEARAWLWLLLAAGLGCHEATPIDAVEVEDGGAREVGIKVDAGSPRDAEVMPRDATAPFADAEPAIDATTNPDATSNPDAATPFDGDVHAGGDVHPSEDCSQYPFSAVALLDELEGFGRAATGGDPNLPFLVTSLAESGPGTLREALESPDPYWIGFGVEGIIVLDQDRIEVTSNKTVDGRGRDITVKGNIRIRDDVNVILTDFKMENDLEGHCTQAGDVLAIGGPRGPTGADYNTRDIWINHMEIYNGGDGLIDIRGATDVTVSWLHLHTHKKGLLWADPEDGLTGGGQHITLHHTFFDRISLRGPQAIGGWLHSYNNYQFQWYEYGSGGLAGAQFLSEQNIYEARPDNWCFIESRCRDPNPCGDFDVQVSKAALVYDWSGNGIGYTKSAGDLALEDAVIQEHEPAQVTFAPASHYSYRLDAADDVLKQRVRDGTGPRVDYCSP